GYFLRGLGAFPVARGRVSKTAWQQAARVLAQGQMLAMFPEGSRSPGARLRPALPGAALLAARSGVPILPVGIAGTERIRGLAWLWHRPRITVSIGESFSLPAVSCRLTQVERTELTDVIMGRIAQLLPASYRGNYGQEEGSDES
ncbi:MAG: 1-acyl-sn-glycerol-3-phosphate acyltransferase, partial [Armatimonadetes bacterium]|nr:1-acyl-sn-glycerol-3-phosphate acyltransferase [Armatimonadota bacterium]